MLEVVACAECALPAEVVDRVDVTSTDGPVETLATVCVAGHRICGVEA